VPSDSAAANRFRRLGRLVDPTHHGGYEDEASYERFLGPSATGFISSKVSHGAALKRQCGLQTAERSIDSGTPSWVT
jgi:hypothetical protein